MEALELARVAVLGYHKVGHYPGDWWSWYYIPEDVFARQLETLRARGWEPIALEQLLSALDGEQDLPPRSALITFDDGYASLLDAAARRLREAAAPAVVFIATDYAGGFNDFDREVEPPERMCEWNELRELAHQGFSIQSHTASHPHLPELSRERQGRELERARVAIERELGSPVSALSYPYGEVGNKAVVEATGHRAAFAYGGQPFAPARADRFALTRIAMGPDTDLARELEMTRSPESPLQ
jgi:peptidoglycan/xylan/chitin deacetylase (PgdA/CDA1 family)